MSREYLWHSESDAPRPETLVEVDDRLSADEALKRVRRHEHLLHVGDFHNAKQLLQAMTRRLPPPQKTNSLREAFREERRCRQREFETLSRVLVEIEAGGTVRMSRGPDVSELCRQLWGTPVQALPRILPLKTLLGMLSATQFRKTGLQVPGLQQPLVPHYGVYVPTRFDYLLLLNQLEDVRGTTVFDIGTGTGVLSLMLLQNGAQRVTATDIEPRAVECATENAARHGFSSRFQVLQRHTFPDGKADLIVCNPPWLPEAPKNRVDRAVFDADNEMLLHFLEQLPSHLTAAGRGVLLISNLAELLELRPVGWLAEQFQRFGLSVSEHREQRAAHSKARDKADPLHAARSREVTSMYVLQVK